MTRSRHPASLPKRDAAVIFAISLMQVTESFLGFILFTGAGTASLAAQGPAPHVGHFTVDDGLAQNRVHAVAQDRAGFIWLCGDRGLQRFDGYSFVQYSTLDSGAPPELDGLIDHIRDVRGTLWVQASGALFRRDPTTQRLVRVPLEHGPHPLSSAWAPDSAGRIWVVDSGAVTGIEPGVTAAPVVHAVAGARSWLGTGL